MKKTFLNKKLKNKSFDAPSIYEKRVTKHSIMNHCTNNLQSETVADVTKNISYILSYARAKLDPRVANLLQSLPEETPFCYRSALGDCNLYDCDICKHYVNVPEIWKILSKKIKPIPCQYEDWVSPPSISSRPVTSVSIKNDKMPINVLPIIPIVQQPSVSTKHENVSDTERSIPIHNLCRYGNSCKNNQCSFVHPSEINCKYGDNCNRPNCYYRHVSSKETQICKLGQLCRDQSCPWIHPRTICNIPPKSEALSKSSPGNRIIPFYTNGDIERERIVDPNSYKKIKNIRYHNNPDPQTKYRKQYQKEPETYHRYNDNRTVCESEYATNKNKFRKDDSENHRNPQQGSPKKLVVRNDNRKNNGGNHSKKGNDKGKEKEKINRSSNNGNTVSIPLPEDSK